MNPFLMETVPSPSVSLMTHMLPPCSGVWLTTRSALFPQRLSPRLWKTCEYSKWIHGLSRRTRSDLELTHVIRCSQSARSCAKGYVCRFEDRRKDYEFSHHERHGMFPLKVEQMTSPMVNSCIAADLVQQDRSFGVDTDGQD